MCQMIVPEMFVRQERKLHLKLLRWHEKFWKYYNKPQNRWTLGYRSVTKHKFNFKYSNCRDVLFTTVNVTKRDSNNNVIWNYSI